MNRHNELIEQRAAHNDIYGEGDWAKAYPNDAAELSHPLTLKDHINAAAACLDDLASGTLSAEDLAREREAAKVHVDRLYALAEVLPCAAW